MDGVNDGNDGRKCGYGQERGPCSRAQEPRTSQTGDGERPMPFSERELDATGRILREHCREQGMCDAIRMYLREPLDHWMETLRCGGDLGRADMAALAVGMSRTLAIRDALLISIIIDEERCPREFLLDFASRPMLPRNARRLEELLSASFHDAVTHPDMARCGRGIGMLLDIIAMVPESYHAAAGGNRLRPVVGGRRSRHAVRDARPRDRRGVFAGSDSLLGRASACRSGVDR